MSNGPELSLPAAYNIADLREQVRQWRSDGLRIGFVPTMGALHDGHLALVKQALETSDRVIVSIFVNPTQFAPGEDFDSYPRTLEADAQKLASIGAHLVYSPDAGEMYPEGYVTTVSLTGPTHGLESISRPHFFNGVATVVCKLLNQVQPDLAVFGEKDYQQLMVIRRMVRDLNLPVEIAGGETVRETDGLALSSRNVYLSKTDRKRAARLNVILQEFADALKDGANVADAQHQAQLKAQSAFDGVDYVVARDAASLEALPSGPIEGDARVLAAVRVGKTRLIDNRPAPKA
ncbi:MAG: pantoate--beta-alanine ligase [Oceanicaulis sp.]|uniref:pantoate--beta-alanine ligase n=1 Tax=unclassified Oceanicaulis TaxID=2632123 RepID=UPI000C538D5F|nr:MULTISPECIES: pantoate--beta-alanine ligase [unclassified Oceanicaulis]MAB68396.1 pantoate--beta-alanine ligase [Oceanicaulis sp.]MBC38360.1 pantoate--beta-alanine ligase [Oceanicaulis sp.]MBG35552.1 pantoate--beta-alanine ligase [Oceanicaulis sp.]HBU60919.1 pantoate--beta-alanine ligase [Oceanicaulis sp.]HCR95605.1 pantoate--beta-alanine ligase [Oceanicaulis sp.]